MKEIGHYRQLVGYPDLFGQTPFYAHRSIPREILENNGRAVNDNLKGCVQIQIKSHGELIWINVPINDLTFIYKAGTISSLTFGQ